MADTYMDGQVQRFQAMLYAKARKEPETRFKHLYKYLTKRHWVEAAVERVCRKRGSRTPGIDGMTRSHVQGAVREDLIATIIEEIGTGTYKPQPARREYIPKSNGKMRPLGIATLKDRFVQEMVKMLIEPIFEAHFLPCSYGFRPNRCTWDALAEIHHYLRYPCLYYTIIEGDIENCFGSINHARLIQEVRRYVLDKRLLALIWGMLKAGVMDNLQYFETDMGTPQGGIVSPLLANIYMHALDEWFHERFHAIGSRGRAKKARHGELAFVRYIRFADDFVVLMRCTEAQMLALKGELAEFVNQELKMTLSEEKTLITQATDGFDFLGVRTFVAPSRKDPTHVLPYQIPAAKSVKSYRDKVRELSSPRRDYITPGERIRTINWLVQGWAYYHRWGNAKETFTDLRWWTIKKVHKMLRRYAGGVGKRTTYKKYFRPISECDNLKRWKRYTNWLTPSVDVGDGYRVGLLPMSVISTASYWKYRGAKIPSAFPLLDEPATGSERYTSFYTADEVVSKVEVNTRKIEGYETLYFLRRKDVFQRDDYTCTECGYQSQRKRGEVNDLECHHITPQGGQEMENLRTVCLSCHHKLTAKAG